MYGGAGRNLTIGGRGRGFVSTDLFNANSRSDQNFFRYCTSDSVRKRQIISTGGGSNEQINDASDPDPEITSNFEEMDNAQKLSAVFATLTCNQNNIIVGLNGRMTRKLKLFCSHNDTLK